jgi:hypothetical protein
MSDKERLELELAELEAQLETALDYHSKLVGILDHSGDKICRIRLNIENARKELKDHEN